MSRKAWILLGLVCIGFGAVIAILVSKLIESRPEKGMVQSFLQSNQTVAERFGAPIAVVYTPEGASVAYHSSSTAGKLCFKISGNKTSGVVRVQWINDAERGFYVEIIDLLNPSGSPERIWQKAGR